ncbi:AP-5 complex subunit zeta-1, partial [Homalodisca vitripennis]
YPAYWSALKPVLSQGLVEVCSQVAPLLLSAFLDSVRDCNEANNSLMPAIFARLPLLCPLPSYQRAVFDLLSQYVTTVWSQQPELLGNPCVAQFLSVTSNIQLCPQLFDTIVSAVGNNLQKEQHIENMFETLEALLREMLVDKSWQNLELVTTVCTAMAKLVGRHPSLSHRATAAFEKLVHVLHDTTDEEKDAVTEHTQNLLRVMKNPRVANVMLSPSSKEDIAMAAILKVLFHFLDS